MIEDSLEVVEFLSTTGQTKSRARRSLWGAVLGIHMIKRRTDLFSIYMGTGTTVNKRRNEKLNYQREIAQAERSGNAEALSALH